MKGFYLKGPNDFSLALEHLEKEPEKYVKVLLRPTPPVAIAGL